MADHAFIRYERIVLDTHNRFHSLVQRGDAKPWLLWHALLPMILPISALLIPRRGSCWLIRPIIFAITLSISVETIQYRRGLLGANGYLVGLVAVWWLIWSSTLLFFNNIERDFRRIERMRSAGNKGATSQQDGHANCREYPRSAKPNNTDKLVWQPYPESFSHRLGWTLALVLNMRGPDFSFRISSLDPLPPQLIPGHTHATKKHSCPRAKARLRAAFVRLLVAYLAIDVLKLILIWDPYFFGTLSAPAPSPFDRLSTFPGLVRFYRSLASGLGVYFALQFVTAANPVFFLGLSLTFPNASRALTATPLDAPWLYADQFGPMTAVLDKGLAGAWGTWWHQLFRFGFVSAAKWVLSFMPTAVSSHRSTRRAITVFVAFGLSGLMHGMGSYTQLGDTRPVSGPFLFFILQALGIFIQEICCRVVVHQLKALGHSPPRWLRRTGNAAFVLGWLLLTGSGIADDFAKGGLWLTEPLPISPVRGLMGRGWLCWRTPWLEYYDDGTYWGSGVRII